MENSNEHWLERLFPPRFSEEDFFSQIHQPEPLICEKMDLERARRTEELYHIAKAKLQEDQGMQRERSPSIQIINEDKPNLEGRKIKELKEETEIISAFWRSANVDAESGESMAEVEGHCLWNAEEFAALRQEMSKEHLGNISLKFQLSFLKAELVELKAKCKKQVTEVEQVKQKLSYSRKEGLCKDAQLEQIQRQNIKKDSKIEALKQDLHEKSEIIRSLKEELQQAREEILHLDLDKKGLQLELKKLKNQQDFENKFAVEKVKLYYDMVVRKLEKELVDTKREQETEKAMNAKNTKALEMLKKHFSSQASSDLGGRKF